ncbi:MAG: PDZ domain-containing protein [Burkholderiales bacterium]
MRRVIAVLALALAGVAAADELGIDVRDGADQKSVEIVGVATGSPAASESLQAGDLVTQVQGTPVSNASQYRQAVQGALGYGEVGLIVMRAGWARHVRLRPTLTGAFGLTTADKAGGAEVVAVAPGSPAAAAGLQPGDVITMADGRALDAQTGFQRIAAPVVARGGALDLAVRRAEWTKNVRLAAAASAAAPAPLAAAAPVPGPAALPSTPARPAPAAVSPPPPSEPAAKAIPAPAAGAVASAPVASAPPARPAPLDLGKLGDATDEVRAANQAYDAQNWPEAEARYARVVKIVPEQAAAWSRLCHAQVMLSQFADAAETCKSAAALASADPSVYQNLGYTLFRLGRYVDSIEPYRKASELKPEWALPYSSAGASFYALGDWSRTEISYRLSVERDPSNAQAWQSLGDAATALRKPAEAVAHYRRAQAAGGGSATLLTLLGWAYLDLGQMKEAEGAFREANRLDPKDANVLLVLGLVADRQGKFDEAREAWERASALGGDNEAGTKARQNLANLDARLAGRSVAAAQPQAMRPGLAPAAGAPATARTAAEESRPDVRPETDSGI